MAYKNQVFKEKACNVCGESFIPTASNQLFCTKVCYNKKKVTSYLKDYKKHNYHTDINFKLKDVMRSRLYHALKNNQKVGSAIDNLGCSVEELKKHIETLWQPGMTWENWARDGWHIDHKEAISKFDLTDIEQVKIACHYTNLQPMWAKENISKGNKDNE